MITIVLTTALLAFLFITSVQISRKLGQAIYQLTSSKPTTIYLLALLFLPGTLAHELAHLITATFLGVPTGVINLIPRFEGGKVIMGSVPIAKTDIFRRAVIGAAPFIAGLSLLLFFSWAFTNFPDMFARILLGYLTFQVANTCFSSSRDMEGALEVIAIILLPIIFFYFFGFRNEINNLTASLLVSFQPLLQTLNQVLLIPLGFNLVGILGINLVNRARV